MNTVWTIITCDAPDCAAREQIQVAPDKPVPDPYPLWTTLGWLQRADGDWCPEHRREGVNRR